MPASIGAYPVPSQQAVYQRSGCASSFVSSPLHAFLRSRAKHVGAHDNVNGMIPPTSSAIRGSCRHTMKNLATCRVVWEELEQSMSADGRPTDAPIPVDARGAPSSRVGTFVRWAGMAAGGTSVGPVSKSSGSADPQLPAWVTSTCAAGWLSPPPLQATPRDKRAGMTGTSLNCRSVTLMPFSSTAMSYSARVRSPPSPPHTPWSLGYDDRDLRAALQAPRLARGWRHHAPYPPLAPPPGDPLPIRF